MAGDLIKRVRLASAFLRRRMVHLNLQLLYECDFRCRICDFWTDGWRDRPRLSAAQVRDIADKLRPIAPLVISIGGGEPTLHDELAEITRILARDHFPVMICNGWHVTPELARALFSAGMHEVSISVDYPDPERHDRQRGKPGAFARALEGLRILHEQRVDPRQRVHLIAVLMEDNLDGIEQLLGIAERMGLTCLITLCSERRGTGRNRPIDGDVVRSLLDLKRRHPAFVALPGYLARFDEAVGPGVRPCRAGRNLFNIDSSGNVSRCIDRLDDPAGNILTDPVHSILERLRAQRERGGCAACWTSCRGSVESLMYGRNPLPDLLALHRMTRPVPLVRTRPVGSPA